jgi:hypothetical protein
MARRSAFRGEGSRIYADRGSKKRLRRIRLRGSWSPEFWFFVILMLLMFFVVVPWVMNHPVAHHHR